jgi:hypothetical protein
VVSVSSFGWTTLAATTAEGGWIGSWSPGIGDPTAAGWITVVAYFGAAVLCWRVYRHRAAHAAPSAVPGYALVLLPWLLALLGRRRALDRVGVEVRARALWLGLSVLLVFLGFNKQLDLQTIVTEVGRMAAHAGDWYANRRVVQLSFIVGVLLAGLWGLRAVWLLAQGNVAEMRAVLLGTVSLLCFVAIRAASFHHVDLLLGYRLAGLRINWILELGAVAIIALGAVMNGAFGGRMSAPGPAPAKAAVAAKTRTKAQLEREAKTAKPAAGPGPAPGPGRRP